jgi:hypothetical protein
MQKPRSRLAPLADTPRARTHTTNTHTQRLTRCTSLVCSQVALRVRARAGAPRPRGGHPRAHRRARRLGAAQRGPGRGRGRGRLAARGDARRPEGVQAQRVLAAEGADGRGGGGRICGDARRAAGHPRRRLARRGRPQARAAGLHLGAHRAGGGRAVPGGAPAGVRHGRAALPHAHARGRGAGRAAAAPGPPPPGACARACSLPRARACAPFSS